MKKEKKTRNKILKVCLLIICSIFIAGASQATSVQAASDATMKKAYQKFVTSHKKSIKYYAYVNIGPNNKPVLLTATDPAGIQNSSKLSVALQRQSNGLPVINR